MAKSYWLLKTEPETYSFSQLLVDQKTGWNGVRNYQARNFLKDFKKGDLALIYHSGAEKAVVGLAKVIQEAYPDPDPKKAGDWVQVGLEAVQTMPQSISLAKIKSTPALNGLLLIKHSRLSVMPVQASHFEILIALGKADQPKGVRS